jgi:hypothetical protein
MVGTLPLGAVLVVAPAAPPVLTPPVATAPPVAPPSPPTVDMPPVLLVRGPRDERPPAPPCATEVPPAPPSLEVSFEQPSKRTRDQPKTAFFITLFLQRWCRFVRPQNGT